MTVYLPQEPSPTRDLSSASRYGALKPLLTSRECQVSIPGQWLNRLTQKLKDFDAETDYICFAGGDPLVLTMAFLALRQHGFHEVSFLKWERERSIDGVRSNSNGFYMPVKVPTRVV